MTDQMSLSQAMHLQPAKKFQFEH